MAKAARLLSDIAAVDAEVDLSGIDVVDAEAEFVEGAAAQVRAQAEVRAAAILGSGFCYLPQSRAALSAPRFFHWHGRVGALGLLQANAWLAGWLCQLSAPLWIPFEGDCQGAQCS